MMQCVTDINVMYCMVFLKMFRSPLDYFSPKLFEMRMCFYYISLSPMLLRFVPFIEAIIIRRLWIFFRVKQIVCIRLAYGCKCQSGRSIKKTESALFGIK